MSQGGQWDSLNQLLSNASSLMGMNLQSCYPLLSRQFNNGLGEWLSSNIVTMKAVGSGPSYDVRRPPDDEIYVVLVLEQGCYFVAVRLHFICLHVWHVVPGDQETNRKQDVKPRCLVLCLEET